MSQRDVTQRFPQLQGQEAELSRHILGFFTHHVQHKFPSKDCKPFISWHGHGRAVLACSVSLLAATDHALVS